jgi:choline-sulfatase
LLVVSITNPHDIAEWSRGQRLPSDGQLPDPPPPDRCPPRRENFATPKNETDSMVLMRKSYQTAPMFPVSGFDENKWRQYIWAYYRLIEKADARVGQVLAALHESGQEENTLVIFTADHGDCQGSHGWNQKTVFYDESTRVPLIISIPGKAKAGTSDQLVNTGVDLIPTMCDFAGIRLPRGLPGLSLKDRCSDEGRRDFRGAKGDKAGSQSREYIVSSHRMVQGVEVGGATPECNGRMVRSDRFKYCVYDIGRRCESLVDMENDPGEMTNLAGDAAYANVLEQHREYLRQWSAKVGDAFAIGNE